MKKGLFYVIGIGAIGFFAFTTLTQTKKVAQPVTVQPQTPQEDTALAHLAASFLDSHPDFQTNFRDATELLPEEKVAQSTGIDEPTSPEAELTRATQPFVAVALNCIQLYREANQHFLRQDYSVSQRGFKQVFRLAESIPTMSEVEWEVKNALLKASRTRMESIRFYSQQQQLGLGTTQRTWWEISRPDLALANKFIATAAQLTGEMILTPADIENPQGKAISLMHFQSLQEATKNILVVRSSSR